MSKDCLFDLGGFVREHPICLCSHPKFAYSTVNLNSLPLIVSYFIHYVHLYTSFLSG